MLRVLICGLTSQSTTFLSCNTMELQLPRFMKFFEDTVMCLPMSYKKDARLKLVKSLFAATPHHPGSVITWTFYMH